MAQSNELKNLLRRIRRFNLANPTLALNVDKAKNVKTARGIAAQVRRLESAQAVAKANKQAATLARKATETRFKGHVYEAITSGKKPFTVRPRKTLAGAQNEVKRAQRELDKARDFERRQNAFVRRAAEYNRKLNGKNSLRFPALPRTEKELATYNKALTAMRRGKLEEARKILGVSPKKEIRKELVRRDTKAAKNSNGFVYRDRVYLMNVLINARHSPIPELGQLFAQGGESLVLELGEAGFTMNDWYDYDKDIEDIHLNIFDKLRETLPVLNGRNKVLVETFLERTEPKYA